MIGIIIIALTLLLTIVASSIGTITGFGLSTIMIPLLVFFLPFDYVLLLVGVIHWFHSLWKIILFPQGIKWSLFFCFGVPALLSSLVGARVIGTSSDRLLPLLGLFLIMYAAIIFFNPRLRVPKTCLMGGVGGIVTGFSAGFFGIRGALRSMFLSAYDLPKKEYLALTGMISLGVDTARILGYMYYDKVAVTPSFLVELLIFVPASFVGSYSARYIVARIPQRYFRRIVVGFLAIIGVRLLSTLFVR